MNVPYDTFLVDLEMGTIKRHEIKSIFYLLAMVIIKRKKEPEINYQNCYK